MQFFLRLEAVQIVIQERIEIYNLKENNTRLCIFLTVGPHGSVWDSFPHNIFKKKKHLPTFQHLSSNANLQCFGENIRITEGP